MVGPQLESETKNVHDCNLKLGSETFLPELPINSQKFEKWWRKIKTCMILSRTHRKSKQIFRSHYAIMNERLRHSKQEHFFIIHPFSLFAIYREHFLCILWMMIFIYEPFVDSFYLALGRHPIIIYAKDSFDIAFFINIILEFFTGYYIPLSRDIILVPRMIRIRYLKTYFFIDFFSCIPYHHITMRSGLTFFVNIQYFLNIVKFLRLLRFKTVNSLAGDLFIQMGMDDSQVKLTKIFLVALFLIHLWGCMFHGLPIVWYNGYANLPQSSWLIKARLFESEDAINPPYNYMISMLTATSHFFGASEAEQYIKDTFEELIASFCLISGFAYANYFLAHFLQIYGAVNVADSKYEELLYQLDEYSHSKKLPQELQQRLKHYYEYKFQKKFFKEVAILNTLSEHLRHEILLFNCRHIVGKVMALKGLSKNVIGGLIANFKLEVYLQNDVIIKQGDPPLKMYFISHGTVSVYCSAGQEITHHEDGDFFGSIQDASTVSIIAAEITETFTMDASDAKYIFKLDKEVADRIKQLQNVKKAQYQVLTHNLERADHQQSVLKDLRQGYILERRRLR